MGASWRLLDLSWCLLGVLGMSWASLGGSSGDPGGPWGFQERSWAGPGRLLGVSWGAFGRSWRRLGERLGLVLGHFWPSCRRLRASWRYFGAFFMWMVFCERFSMDFIKIFREVEYVKKASGTTKIVVLSLQAIFTES